MSPSDREREGRPRDSEHQPGDVSAETLPARTASGRQATDSLIADTHPEALALQLASYSRMTPAERLDIVRDLTLTSSRLALAGLHARHPGETRPELLLRLARIRLGKEVIAAAYGPFSAADGA